MCSTNTLVHFCVVLGVLFSLASVTGLCLSLYLVFGDPIRKSARDTYEPSWEDIGTLCIKGYLYENRFWCRSLSRDSARPGVDVVITIFCEKFVFFFKKPML
jgi:hypothetical protein